ncbi:hypothetical protein [Cytobacillus gottheilii]|uniref:hypothetical protein n=1 Tax=Cytobacillus gottheilii TaxID=859144 RepID=UPI0024941893|nr:hypothetical protein [Cytobacillus gottheilii]
MFGSILDDVYQSICSNTNTLTGMDLYEFKSGFYEKSVEYMGHSKNLTGITELLVSMYLKNYLIKKNSPLKIENNAKRIGENGRQNEVDIAFVDPSRWIDCFNKPKIVTGFSIKNEIGGAQWQAHEKTSEYCCSIKEKYGSNNLAQDLFRLENIKRGSNTPFNSCTIIFEKVDTKYERYLQTIKRDYPNHYYIILYKNNIPIWEELSKLEL